VNPKHFHVSPISSGPLITATTYAWNSAFKGDRAHSLFDTIADYLSRERTPYARLTTVVNSSGTGKSRMVDQLGIDVITVPMCLRQKEDEGFQFCFIFISMACLQFDLYRIPSY
jgi:hypothetical protein